MLRTLFHLQMSGLSTWIGKEFKEFAGFNPLLMSLIILLVVSFNTEVMSNPATAQLFIPILRDMVSFVCNKFTL